MAVPAHNGRSPDGSAWRRWSCIAGRLLFDGLVAVGTYTSGLMVPYTRYHLEEEIERALWSQLREVHRLLPLLDRLPEDGVGRGSPR
jgi:hypothetical protein